MASQLQDSDPDLRDQEEQYSQPAESRTPEELQQHFRDEEQNPGVYDTDSDTSNSPLAPNRRPASAEQQAERNENDRGGGIADRLKEHMPSAGDLINKGGHEGGLAPSLDVKNAAEAAVNPEKAGSLLGRHKGLLIGSAVGGLFATFGIIILMVFILLIGPFKGVHFATVLRSAGFARYNYVLKQQYAKVTFDAATLSDSSTGNIDIQKSPLLSRMLGWNPYKQAVKWGTNGRIKYDVTGEDRLKGLLPRKNTFNGISIDSQQYNLADYMPKGTSLDDLSPRERMYVRSQFALAVREGLYSVDGLNFWTRSQLMKAFYQATGISLLKWSNKAKEYFGKDPADARKTNVDETLKQVEGDATPMKSGIDEIRNESDQYRKDEIAAAEGGTAPTTASPGTVRSKMAARVKTMNKISDVATAVTVACVARDLALAYQQALPQREAQADRMGAMLMSTGAQVEAGDVAPEAVGADANQWTGAETSAYYEMDTNQTVTDPQQIPSIPSVKPAGWFASIMNAVTKIPGFELANGLRDVPVIGQYIDFNKMLGGELCTVATNRITQYGLAGIEGVAAVITLGSVRGLFEGVKVAFETALQFGAGIGLSDLLGQFIDSAVKSFANMDFSGIETGADRYNTGRVAVDMLSQTPDRQLTYGRPMSIAETSAGEQSAMDDLRTQNAKQSFGTRYFAISNPFSLVGNIVATIPTSLGTMAASLQHNLASLGTLLTSPLRVLGSLGGSLGLNHLALADDPRIRNSMYDDGVDHWGWTTQELERVNTDPAFSLQNLVQTVEPNIDSLNAKYDKCYNQVFTQDKVPDGCDAATLSSDEALRWRAYKAELYDINTLNSDSSDGSSN